LKHNNKILSSQNVTPLGLRLPASGALGLASYFLGGSPFKAAGRPFKNMKRKHTHQEVPNVHFTVSSTKLPPPEQQEVSNICQKFESALHTAFCNVMPVGSRLLDVRKIDQLPQPPLKPNEREIVVFHGSPNRNYASIIANGFVPTLANDGTQPDTDFSPSIRRAHFYTRTTSRITQILLCTIKINLENMDKFLADRKYASIVPVRFTGCAGGSFHVVTCH
jgi:hypothetical protein